MKSRILSLAVLGAFTLASVGAVAAPVKLTKAQMDRVVAGVNPHLQMITVNPGGVADAGNSCTSNPNCQTINFKTAGKP